MLNNIINLVSFNKTNTNDDKVGPIHRRNISMTYQSHAREDVSHGRVYCVA